MIQILATVAAIALAGVLLVAGLSTLDAGAGTRIAAGMMADAGHSGLSQAFDAYRIANNGASPQASTDGTLPADLAPYVGMAPRAPEGTAWSYVAGSDGTFYACLSGQNVGRAVYEGLLKAPRYDDAAGVYADCAGTPVPDTGFDGRAAFRFAMR